METDAGFEGVGAVLSQPQEGTGGLLHSVAYANCSLTAAERNFLITELEMLALEWLVTHFIDYLCRHDVTVYTDHTAIKAVLDTSNPLSNMQDCE